MPRLLHRPPKYWRHKPTGQAAVTVSGKRFYLGKYGSDISYQRYAAVINRWRKAREAASPAADLDESPVLANITPAALREKRESKQFISINELIVVYRRHARTYYRKDGKVTREAEQVCEVLAFLRKHHGKMSAADFGPVALDALRESMIDEFDWSRKHLNKQVSRLVRMFKWAAEHELLDPSVHSALAKKPGLKKGRTRARETLDVTPVADDVVNATLPELPEVIADMVRLQRLTGARPGEVCRMKPADVDRTEDVWVYAPLSHKTDHHDLSRVVMIGPQAQEVLAPYLLRPSDSFCFTPEDCDRKRCAKLRAERKTPLKKRDLVRLANPVQKSFAPCYNTTSYRQAIQRACKRLKIDNWAPNQLRHTAATLIRKSYGIEGAQVVCGHQSANVTEVYAERDMDLAKRIAREVG